MADVTGPISTLSGALHAPPPGTKCDDHDDRLATTRILGETDSFGSEMHDLCDECAAKFRLAMRDADTSGRCDWCKQEVDKRVDRRSTDEGLYGPVYRVCIPCRDLSEARIREELDQYDLDCIDDYGDDPDDADDFGTEPYPDDLDYEQEQP